MVTITEKRIRPGDPQRWRRPVSQQVLDSLLAGEFTIGQAVEYTGLSRRTLSRHLARMRAEAKLSQQD